MRLDAELLAHHAEAPGEHLPDAEPGGGLDLGEVLARDQKVDELLGVHLDVRESAQLRVEPVAERVANPPPFARVAHRLEEHHPERNRGSVRGLPVLGRRQAHGLATGSLRRPGRRARVPVCDRRSEDGDDCQHGTTGQPARRQAPRQRDALGADLPRHDQVGVHRVGDVLQALAPEVDERLVELVPDVAVDAVGDADRSRPGEGLQARGDVDGVAEGRPLAQEQIPEVDPDAQL